MCGDNPTIKELIDYEQFCGVRGQAPRTGRRRPRGAGDDGRGTQEAHDRQGDAVFVLDVREPQEFQIGRIPGAS